MRAIVDLTSLIFGRLTVIGRATNSGVKVRWRCRCICGNECLAQSYDLKRGKQRSCGCLHRDIVTKHGHADFKDGIRTKTYRTWQHIWQRCTNPVATGYASYGGRGITVCKRWAKFPSFLADMGEPPSTQHTIERIDVDSGYTPSNCRWATRAEQSVNRRTNRRITYQGKTQTVIEWCRELGMSEDVIRGRLKLGWSFEDAVNIPVTTAHARVDMAGQRFGRLVVVKYDGTIGKRALWLCKCDCGNTCVAVGKYLRQLRVVSCGCKRGQKKETSSHLAPTSKS